jgi:hypothetical protein
MLSPITRLMMFAVGLRFASDLLELYRLIGIYGPVAWPSLFGSVGLFGIFGSRLSLTPPVVWALHEFPQTIVYVVDIIFLEGAFRVWRNLKRVRLALEAGAAA